MEKRLPEITSPTLIIWGTADLEREDRDFGFHITQKRHLVGQMISGSKTVELTGPNSTAAMTSRMRDEFAGVVLQFLKKV